MSGRCKLCDAALKPHEIVWNEANGEHEEWCSKCQVQGIEDDAEEQLDNLLGINIDIIDLE